MIDPALSETVPVKVTVIDPIGAGVVDPSLNTMLPIVTGVRSGDTSTLIVPDAVPGVEAADVS